MSEMVEQFRAYRAKMNEKILAADNKVIKRTPIHIWTVLYPQK